MKVTEMKLLRPRSWIIVGFLLLASAAAYDTFFAGIPYQDPTPEQQASYERHQNVAKVLGFSGLGLFWMGLGAGMLGLGRRKRATRAGSGKAVN